MSDDTREGDLTWLEAHNEANASIIDAAMTLTAMAKKAPFSPEFRTALLNLIAACQRLRELEARA